MRLKQFGDMKATAISLLLSLLCSSVSGQNLFSDPPENWRRLDRGITLTLVIPSFMTSPYSNLSSLLVQNGYPPIPRGSLNYGIGLAYRIKRYEFGGDFSVGSQYSTNYDQRSEILRRPLNGNLFLQYHLFRKGSFTFYPILGLSITDTNLIASKQSSVTDMNSLLQNPGTSVNLQHSSGGLLTGFGVALAEHWEESTGVFRLKFAYRVPFGKGYAWESFFANIEPSSPLDNFPYFFIQFEMGVLSNWKKGEPWMDKY
jgi:hypothetical protein